jgi:hypothetical protein
LKRAAAAALTGRAGSPVAQRARIEAAWQAFAQALCNVDVAARDLMASELPSYGEPECQLLQTVRGAYLMSSWAKRDVNGLHRHILARRSWSRQAGAGLSRVTRKAAEKLLTAREQLARALCSAWPGLDDTTDTCTELLELHLLSYAQQLGTPPTGR